jgi:hypothetical protein
VGTFAAVAIASQMRGDMVRRPKRAGFNLEVVNEARKNASFLRVRPTYLFLCGAHVAQKGVRHMIVTL